MVFFGFSVGILRFFRVVIFFQKGGCIFVAFFGSVGSVLVGLMGGSGWGQEWAQSGMAIG